MEIGKRFHICATRLHMLRWIEDSGINAVMPSFDGTDEEAMQAVRDDPREFFAPSECDNVLEDGSCGGHEM